METLIAVTALSALAQETRLNVFRLLVTAGREGMAAGKIADRLGLPLATLSFHLAQLKQAGLITCRRESRSLIYAANYAAAGELVRFLTENCCGDSPAGCSPECPPASSRDVAVAEVAKGES